MDDSWTCGKCGWTNRGGRFCFDCGRDGDPAPVAVGRVEPEPDANEARWRRPALVGGAIALLAVVTVAAVVLLSGGDGDDGEAPAPKVAGAAPVALSKLARAQTVDELMKIVVASRAGLALARKGEWAQAAKNRRQLVGRLDVLATRTDAIEGARTALASALKASEHANDKSLACKDKGSVSACAAPAHRRATTLKERFRHAFNKILSTEGRDPIAADSF